MSHQKSENQQLLKNIKVIAYTTINGKRKQQTLQSFELFDHAIDVYLHGGELSIELRNIRSPDKEMYFCGGLKYLTKELEDLKRKREVEGE